MDFSKVIQRAVEIRKKYSQLEQKKYGKSWSREQIFQGLVGDIGDLSKVVMAKEGMRKTDGVNDKLKHELVDCLWSILVLAEGYGIDIERVFFEEMDKLEKKITFEK